MICLTRFDLGWSAWSPNSEIYRYDIAPMQNWPINCVILRAAALHQKYLRGYITLHYIEIILKSPMVKKLLNDCPM